MQHQKDVPFIAEATIECLLNTVPAAVQGIAFLSGGQPAEKASARLNAINDKYRSASPWQLSFSFGRALQQQALELWNGDEANTKAAQQVLYHRAKCNLAASMGKYTSGVENAN